MPANRETTQLLQRTGFLGHSRIWLRSIFSIQARPVLRVTAVRPRFVQEPRRMAPALQMQAPLPTGFTLPITSKLGAFYFRPQNISPGRSKLQSTKEV